MAENDYLDRIDECWIAATSEAQYIELAALIDRAIDAHPSVAEFHRLRGMIEFMHPEGDASHAKSLYEQALSLDPHDGETLCELDYWFDICEDDHLTAFRYFRRSLSHGAGIDAWYGLVRCVLQRDRVTAARRILAYVERHFPAETMTQSIRDDIESGTWSR